MGFLAAQLTGAQSNLLEYIACNIYICIYIYMYMWVYVYVCMYIYICIYANNLNDPRHYFVIKPSSLFCMDVCDHIINVVPVHSLNKRFLILILILNSKLIHSISLWKLKRNHSFLFVMAIMSAAVNKCYRYSRIFCQFLHFLATLGFWLHHSPCSLWCWTNNTLEARSLSPE